MIYVGIDVAKNKHDCFVTSSDGKVLFPVFTIQNNREGFDDLFSKIQSVSSEVSNIKVGLEATGHYSYNLLGYLIDKGLPTYVINPVSYTHLVLVSMEARTPLHALILPCQLSLVNGKSIVKLSIIGLSK